MPRVPVSPEVDELLRRPNPAVIATLRPDGSPHSVPTWYDWEDGRVLLNMEDTRLRLGYMRRDPRVSLTVLAEVFGMSVRRSDSRWDIGSLDNNGGR